MYMEHWKMKESSVEGSEPSNVSGRRGFVALFVVLGVEMLAMCRASSAREWARLGVGRVGSGSEFCSERAEL
jgi:hypothetical protein